MVIAISWLIFIPLAHMLTFAPGQGWGFLPAAMGICAVGGCHVASTDGGGAGAAGPLAFKKENGRRFSFYGDRDFTTGGTIDKVYFDCEGQLSRRLPHGARTAGERTRAKCRKSPNCCADSLEMTDADRQAIRAGAGRLPGAAHSGDPWDDTMVATALALTGLPGKTIVLTGALQPGRCRQRRRLQPWPGLAPPNYVQRASTWWPMVRFSRPKVRKNLELNRFSRCSTNRDAPARLVANWRPRSQPY